MNYEAIITDRAKFASDDEFIAFANSVEYSPKMYFASVRTVYNLMGPAVASSVLAGLEQADPVAASFFKIPGDENGTGGGIDMSLPQAQGMIDSFKANGILNDEQAKTLKDLGRTVSISAMTRYGIDVIDASVLLRANRESEKDRLQNSIRNVFNIVKEKIDNISESENVPTIRALIDSALSIIGK